MDDSRIEPMNLAADSPSPPPIPHPGQQADGPRPELAGERAGLPVEGSAKAGVRGQRKLSSESLYLQIAAPRAFYRYAENEKLLPTNVAENLPLPRRWQRLPKSL